jgi:hypothetical protein
VAGHTGIALHAASFQSFSSIIKYLHHPCINFSSLNRAAASLILEKVMQKA